MPGSNSDIITVDGDRAFVLRVSEHKAEAVKPLAEVKAQVTDIVKHNKAEQQAKLDAEKLLVALKDGKGDEALKAAGLSFGSSKTLSRAGQDPLSPGCLLAAVATERQTKLRYRQRYAGQCGSAGAGRSQSRRDARSAEKSDGTGDHPKTTLRSLSKR
ncbi:Peptidyl-prolyl cis-trans isomerase D [Kluyvera cryocrescens]|uniref:Peptidyl-prolyl cis-trans isomerase D n=1 Tax=Kluyvera cryocrescens TaxID=580 RepID=A0A485CYS8_KLUCR|nr:Peptidyl-prolyl cis-trans isomerase D [Kluyvera cryocrescens]